MHRCRGIPFAVASALALAIYLVPVGTALGSSAAGKLGLDEPMWASDISLCADPGDSLGGYYVGHDEPSLEFKSNIPGSGNDVTYLMTLPKDPKVQPNASGAGGTTWNFQLRPTFWFGMTLCDTESAPEFTKTCTPDSDANDLTGTNPNSQNYIGKHPGNAYMELQFYGPGYVEQFEGFGCTAHQYCAAMTIDSRTLDQNNGTAGTTGTENTKACNNYVLGGPEPINWAYVTRSGQSQAPANPLFTGTFSSPNFSAVDPDPTKDLFMNPGDRILIHMHDTPAGFQVNLVDLTSRQAGSMTASVAQRVRPHPVHAELDDLSGGAVRLPSRVLHREHAREHVERSHVQRRDVGRDRAFRELPGDRCGPQLHPARQPGPRPRRGRREQLLRPGRRLDAGEDQRVLQ
jgi:hypothetical protein